ncbi:hypothetical protein ZIOFF_003242 [Zingiber officinale]|uniref:Uncharacterized protein n=1 Tax=Zingiber officinale TaxID=94328 RepID=A0A8J5I678_ZINOF|nr:hypothetical protein ZIOFF_003242 [Zingiber officinale]
MEHLHEICKCLKTLVDFLLCHCDSLPKHDPKPWDPPFDPSQPKLDPPLAVAVAVFLFVATALSSHYHHDLSGRETLVRITASSMNMFFDGNKIGFLVAVLNAIRLDFVSEAWLLRLPSLYGCILWKRFERFHTLEHLQGLGLGFTYDLAICSCALQLWVGRFLISNGKTNGGEIITALFVVILSSLGLNQVAINFYSFEQGRIVAYKLFEMISSSNSSLNQDGSTLATMNDSRKSNIIPLIECFYDLTLGEEPTLLSLSIKDNIAYGRSATSDQIEEAAKTVHAHDFITSLVMGYETQVDLAHV